MSAPDPQRLFALLAELERTRSVVLGLLERAAAAPGPPPPGSPAAAVYELLLAARRSVLGNPAAARALYDLLAREGRRYAGTEAGAALRDRLAASEQVDRLRRVWELLSLNALDGPVAPCGIPDGWVELIADVVAGESVDAVLDGLGLDGLGLDGLGLDGLGPGLDGLGPG